MANTFNPALTDDISLVRLKVGDTGDGGWELADETIQYFLDLPLSVTATAAKLAWTLFAKYAGQVDVNVDNQLQRASHVAKQYELLAIRLDKEAAAESSASAGGTSPYNGIMVQGVGDCRGPLDDDCCRR